MLKQRKKRILYWEGKGPSNPTIQLKLIDHFDARGKHRVYGRGDHFPRLVLNMDIWRDRNGRLLVRFWSRNREIDWYSYEIMGFMDAIRPEQAIKEQDEKWVPECLRDEYENWALSEL